MLITLFNRFGFNNDVISLLKYCAILTFIFLTVIVLVGFFTDILVKLQIKILSKFIGQKASVFILNHFTFIGTIVHESAHACLLFITGAKITEFKVIDFGKKTLGHVSYKNRGFYPLRALQNSLSASAPVTVGFFIEIILCHFIALESTKIIIKLLLIYVFYSISCHMAMSKTDLKLYIKGIWSTAIATFTVIFLWNYITLRQNF